MFPQLSKIRFPFAESNIHSTPFVEIVALFAQFIPSESSLVYPVVVGNDCFSFRLIYPLTTYNPVMDNLPCEYIIYVLTAIDNISHALFGRSLVLPSRVRFVFLVESNVHPLTSLLSLSSG